MHACKADSVNLTKTLKNMKWSYLTFKSKDRNKKIHCKKTKQYYSNENNNQILHYNTENFEVNQWNCWEHKIYSFFVFVSFTLNLSACKYTVACQTDSLLLTSKKLHAPCHASDGSGDELWYAAAHERSERHQQQKTASHPRHDCTDPPFHTRDSLKARIAPALLQHDRSLPLLIPNGIRAPPESAEGHRFIHLWAQQPVRHEKAHAGSCCTQQGHQSPYHPCARQAGCHAGQMSLNIVRTSRRELGKRGCHKK